MIVWCKVGRGTLVINGQRFDVHGDDIFFLPWLHDIEYHADVRQPFLTAGIHLIPWHGREQPVEYQVAHFITDPLTGLPWRSDRPLPGYEGLVAGSLRNMPVLRNLIDYTVHVFLRADPDETMARHLGQLLLHEMELSLPALGDPATPLPADLQRMLYYIREHLHEPLRLEELITFTELSASTIGRLFRQHLGVSAGGWITQHKMERAQELLRTTQLTVGDVGAKVGIADPYYFSKLFKKVTGWPPLEWRRLNHPL
jgi:AraC-like DNA-binding protein